MDHWILYIELDPLQQLMHPCVVWCYFNRLYVNTFFKKIFGKRTDDHWTLYNELHLLPVENRPL